MNSYFEPNGTHGAIQVTALDYMFRWWAELFGNRRSREAQSQLRGVTTPLAACRPLETTPAPCGC